MNLHIVKVLLTDLAKRTRLLFMADTFSFEECMVEKPRDFAPFGQTGLPTFGYNMIAPLKS